MPAPRHGTERLLGTKQVESRAWLPGGHGTQASSDSSQTVLPNCHRGKDTVGLAQIWGLLGEPHTTASTCGGQNVDAMALTACGPALVVGALPVAHHTRDGSISFSLLP